MIVHERKKSGIGLINSLINELPIELHVPGYGYCGPRAKSEKRLARGDPGFNLLDSACKEHDIAYSENPDEIAARHQADRVFAEKARQRMKSKDSKIGEKVAAWAVTNAMKARVEMGMSLKKEKKKKISRKMEAKKTKKPTVTLKQLVRMIRKESSESGKNLIEMVLKRARSVVKEVGGKRNVRLPRILPVLRKIGGALPFLIPLFACLSCCWCFDRWCC